jgi:hypothetical protein
MIFAGMMILFQIKIPGIFFMIAMIGFSAMIATEMI